jgi:hypothetical protein
MSHNPNPNADTSGFNYSSAAGVPTNLDQNFVGIAPTGNSSTTESSSSVPLSQMQSTPNNHVGPALDRNFGKLGGEHGGSGTRTDDRKGETVPNDGYTVSPTAQHTEP